MKSTLRAVLVFGLMAIPSTYASAQTPACGVFQMKWGTRCDIFTGEGCVDPDGPGPLELGDGQLGREPTHIEIDANGDVYVVDQYNFRVLKFDPDGNFLHKFGGNFAPWGIAFAPSGNIFIADATNSRVRVFAPDLTPLFDWGSFCEIETGRGCVDPDGNEGPLELGDGQFFFPRRLAVDAAGSVYVPDFINNRIQKFDSSGQFLLKWGAPGVGEGEFNKPSAVAVDASGDVYVADSNNFRIQKFDSEGNFLEILAEGVGGSDVAIDHEGNIYEPRSSLFVPEILAFDSAGELIARWGSLCNLATGEGCVDPDGVGPLELGDGQFRAPTSVALDGLGRVYVLDTFNSRVQRFSCALSIECNGGGTALSFDGNDVVTFGVVPTLTLHTLEAWIKPDPVSAGGGNVVVGHIGGPGQVCGFGTMLTADGGRFCYDLDPAGCGTNNYICHPLDASETWIHIAGTFDGSVGRVYLNGTLVNERPGVSFAPSNWMTAGAITFSNGQSGFFQGEIDEIRIWNVARTENQIRETMNRSLSGAEVGLAGYWRFDEGVDQSVADLSSTGITGVLGTSGAVLSNDPTWVASAAPICAACPEILVSEECPLRVDAGVPVDFTVMVSNAGAETASDIILTELVDGNVTIDDAFCTAGTCSTLTGPPDTLECQLGSLYPGQGVTCTFTFTFHDDPETCSQNLMNSITVTTGAPECDVTPNGDVCDFFVACCGDGFVDTNEDCDDGGIADNDCCSSDCQFEVLGDEMCGIGECQRTIPICANGMPQDCIAGEPSEEICDGIDNDCDGFVDEEIYVGCYEGPEDTNGIGVCRAGASTCSGGEFGPCEGQILPSAEICDDLDNDCDGFKDEGGRLDTDLVFAEPLTRVLVISESQADVEIAVENIGVEPVRVTKLKFLSGEFDPAVSSTSEMFPTTIICPGESTLLPLRVNAGTAAEGLHTGILHLSEDTGLLGETTQPLEIRIVPEGLPDLTLNSLVAVRINGQNGLQKIAANENVSASATVSNIGLSDAGPYRVNVFDGLDLLGLVDDADGLVAGGAEDIQFDLPGGLSVEGFHVIRLEIVPLPEGEITIDNNIAATVVQVGELDISGALLVVKGSAGTDCSGERVLVGGRADYLLASATGALFGHPAQGLLTTMSLLDSTGTIELDTFGPTHTLTTGTYSGSMAAPGPGDYVIRVEVTDLSLTTVYDISLHIPAGEPNCNTNGGGGGTIETGPNVDLAICGSDVALLKADCATSLSDHPSAGEEICILATIHNLGTDGVVDQPVSFMAHVQDGSGLAGELIETQTVTFVADPSGTAFVEMMMVKWTLPADGEHVIEVHIEPTISENRSNNIATRGLKVGSAIPATEIDVVANGVSCLGWVSGRARYADSTLNVGCGDVTVEVYDAANPDVPLSFVSGVLTDAFGSFVSGTGVSLPEGEYITRVTVNDGALEGVAATTTSFSCPNSFPPGGGGGGVGPIIIVPPPPPPPPPLDLFLFSEDIAFVGSCDPSTGLPLTGLFGNPEVGDTLGVFARIHYVGPKRLFDQPVEVKEWRLSGDELKSFDIGMKAVSFPNGSGVAPLCLPWTPTSGGVRIVQVVVLPTEVQYKLNDAATRAFMVGSTACDLQLSTSSLFPSPELPASLTVTGIDNTDLTVVMDLRVASFPPHPLPSGLTTSFEPPPPLVTPFTTELTVGIDDTTPPGSHQLFIVGFSDVCQALVPFSVKVPVCFDCSPVLTVADPDPVQYSDWLQLEISATDPNDFPEDLAFSVEGLMPADLTLQDNNDGTATVSGNLSVAEGEYPVTIVVTDPSGKTDRKEIVIRVLKENASIAYNGATMVKENDPVTLSALVTEEDDGHPGDISLAEIFFDLASIIGGGARTVGPIPVSAMGDAIHQITQNLAADIYEVTVRMDPDNGYYQAPPDDAVVVVYDPDAGFTTGGGWIIDGGKKANFGFNVKYAKNSDQIKGQAVFHFRLDGERIRMKSNAMDWLVINGKTAIFSGKASVLTGNHRFEVTVVDNGEPGRNDLFGIKLWRPDGSLLHELSLTSLGGGNLIVPQPKGQGGNDGRILRLEE